MLDLLMFYAKWMLSVVIQEGIDSFSINLSDQDEKLKSVYIWGLNCREDVLWTWALPIFVGSRWKAANLLQQQAWGPLHSHTHPVR